MKHKNVETNYIPVFNKIEELLKKDISSIIAIDGMSSSGKSYLANLIAQNYECNVFHMDEFFLPLEMKTEERLTQPGANVHYERFKEEVLNPLCENRKVIYRPYICGLWSFDEPREVQPKKLNIIEGSYCMHPQLRQSYDLTIFLEVDEKEQIERILRREGKEKLQQFINKWIPLENYYFNELKIKEICKISLDTTNF
jgi:uridine kinase